ncbi:MAG: 50S ribosomal protein L30 [Marinilabiliales bacterium]|nr:MAG: 50S ribosomal protein L30 [Marinilabiliales bacterium]
MAKIRITQVKSRIGSNQSQKRTLDALGLKRISSSIEAESTPQVLGMVEKVRHLLKVEKIK